MRRVGDRVHERVKADLGVPVDNAVAPSRIGRARYCRSRAVRVEGAVVDRVDGPCVQSRMALAKSRLTRTDSR